MHEPWPPDYPSARAECERLLAWETDHEWGWFVDLVPVLLRHIDEAERHEQAIYNTMARLVYAAQVVLLSEHDECLAEASDDATQFLDVMRRDGICADHSLRYDAGRQS